MLNLKKYKTGVSEQAAKMKSPITRRQQKLLLITGLQKNRLLLITQPLRLKPLVLEGDSPPPARVKSDKYGIVDTVTTQNNADQVEKTKG